MGYRRKLGDNHRLQKNYRATRHSCLAGVYYDHRKGRLIRLYQGSRAKYLRHCGNKRVWRAKITLQHGGYWKLFDYWWELW